MNIKRALTGQIDRQQVKSALKKVPGLQNIYDVFNLHRRRGKSKIDIITSFPLYQPSQDGTYKDRALLAIQTINQLPSAIKFVAESVGYKKPIIQDIQNIPHNKDNSAALKRYFDKYESDKATIHNYHLLYSSILEDRKKITKVFEIGIGTNFTDIRFWSGSPGASLRAFRDYLPNVRIYGADIDRRVLFTEERIETYYLDQTNQGSFKLLNQALPDDFDLMVDDGLHSPNANLYSLAFFLPKLKVNGWAIIEDIGRSALPVWELIGSILPSCYGATIFETKAALLFAVQRKE